MHIFAAAKHKTNVYEVFTTFFSSVDYRFFNKCSRLWKSDGDGSITAGDITFIYNILLGTN